MTKSTQNTTPKRKSGIYLNKIHKATAVALLLMLLCYCFSTMALGTDITTYNIALMRMYGSNSPDTSNPQWRSQSYTIIDKNNIVTSDIVYSQTRQLLEFTFTQVYVKSIEIDFDMYCILYGSDDFLTINQSGTPKIEIYTPYKSINISYNKLDNYHIHYHYSSTEVNRNVEKIDIYTNINIISSKLYVSNINIKINNEIFIALNEYSQAFNDLKTAEENLYNSIDSNGVSGLPSRLQQMQQHYAQVQASIHNAGFEINKQYFDSILNASTAITAMLTMTMVITVCSYALFGKLR